MMTISKKLVFMIFCAFGTQITYPSFDVSLQEAQINQIIEFVDQLFKHNTSEARKTAKWLIKQIHDDGTKILDAADVAEIAKAVVANTAIDTKIRVIQGKMIEKMQEEKAAKEKKYAEDLEEERWARKSRGIQGVMAIYMIGVMPFVLGLRVGAFIQEYGTHG